MKEELTRKLQNNQNINENLNFNYLNDSNNSSGSSDNTFEFKGPLAPSAGQKGPLNFNTDKKTSEVLTSIPSKQKNEDKSPSKKVMTKNQKKIMTL